MALRKIKFILILIVLVLLTLYIAFYCNFLSALKNSYNFLFFSTSFQKNEANYLTAYYLSSNCDCRKNNNIGLYEYEKNYSVKFYKDDKNKAKFVYNLTKYEFETFNTTCDLYNVLRRGKSQKVLSFSLFGKNKFYYHKLKKISKQIKILYPGWLMRVYYNNSIEKSLICEIECLKDKGGEVIDNSDFCNINDVNLKFNKIKNIDNGYGKLNVEYMLATKWRWFPIADSFVDVFSSRDSDSYILQREIDSVNVWLNSTQVVHIMRG